MSEVHTRTLGHIHFGLTEAEMRCKAGSTANFHGPMPICGYGLWYAHTSRNPQNITCAACKELLAANPSYLSKVY